MDNMQGGQKVMYHNFSMNVPAYFNYTGTALNTALRTTRNHAFDLIDLFNGDDNQIGHGFIYRFELEQGYYEIVDKIIHTYNVKFFVKVLDYETI
jgi:hypothetical protein